jgi:bacterioferritin-associated ferredoxin
MIVCVCNALREQDVRHAARDGATKVCEAYAKFGRKARCGQCVPHARTIIDQERYPSC